MNAYRQLPEGDALFFDHHGHFVPDMDAASAALERMGFRLTPYTAHTMTTDPDRPPQPSGTANRCIMLRESYIEILCAVGDAPLARQLHAAVRRYTGIHLLAFATADAAGQHARLAAAGFAMQPLVHLTRDVDGGTLRFSVVRMEPGQMAEGRIQMLTHETPDLLWREELLDQPNRVVAMRDVVLASADPGECAERFGRYFGFAAEPLGDGRVFRLGRGSLTILPAPALERALPGIAIPDLPFIAATTLHSDDLGATRGYLSRQGVGFDETAPGILRVEPMPALGSTFLIMARDATAPWLAG